MSPLERKKQAIISTAKKSKGVEHGYSESKANQKLIFKLEKK